MSNYKSILENLLSIKGAIFIIGKISLITAVGLAYATGNNWQESKKYSLPEFELETSDLGEEKKVSTSLSTYSIITSRNIFGPGTQKTNQEPTQNEPVTQLKLRLVGTNLTKGRKPFAIIEDTSKKNQDVFDLNQSIFEQATLLEILEDRVRIGHNGEIETLLLDDGVSSGSSNPGEITSSDDGSEFSVPEEDLNQALANLPRLLSQARAVPYFRNGKSIGMRLFAIRRGSLYEKLGLKNGDILLSVNDNSLSDPSQALKIFEQLKSERSINVNLERTGQAKTLNYSID